MGICQGLVILIVVFMAPQLQYCQPCGPPCTQLKGCLGLALGAVHNGYGGLGREEEKKADRPARESLLPFNTNGHVVLMWCKMMGVIGVCALWWEIEHDAVHGLLG